VAVEGDAVLVGLIDDKILDEVFRVSVDIISCLISIQARIEQLNRICNDWPERTIFLYC